jgi:hypothetical protein
VLREFRCDQFRCDQFRCDQWQVPQMENSLTSRESCSSSTGILFQKSLIISVLENVAFCHIVTLLGYTTHSYSCMCSCRNVYPRTTRHLTCAVHSININVHIIQDRIIVVTYCSQYCFRLRDFNRSVKQVSSSSSSAMLHNVRCVTSQNSKDFSIPVGSQFLKLVHKYHSFTLRSPSPTF